MTMRLGARQPGMSRSAAWLSGSASSWMSSTVFGSAEGCGAGDCFAADTEIRPAAANKAGNFHTCDIPLSCVVTDLATGTHYCTRPAFTSSCEKICTFTGFAFQMSSQYSRIVRSDENLPERAELRID